MRKAFTLAEILITLGIIGIVSAITIPTLITKYQKKVTVEKLKLAYAILTQAVKSAEQDNGDMATWSLQLSNDEFSNYVLPYLKGWSKYPYYKVETNGGVTGFNWIAPLYILNNGMVISFNNDCNQLLQITVDINGKSKPNYMGKDTFIFTISPSRNQLLPYGTHRINISREYLTSANAHGCSKDATGRYAREYCAGLIMHDNWQISNDYPW